MTSKFSIKAWAITGGTLWGAYLFLATLFASTGFLYVVFWVGVVVGWVMNVMYLIRLESLTPLTGELAMRLIGIFIVPLGGIMGLFF